MPIQLSRRSLVIGGAFSMFPGVANACGGGSDTELTPCELAALSLEYWAKGKAHTGDKKPLQPYHGQGLIIVDDQGGDGQPRSIRINGRLNPGFVKEFRARRRHSEIQITGPGSAPV